jgi:hypothetical protein
MKHVINKQTYSSGVSELTFACAVALSERSCRD